MKTAQEETVVAIATHSPSQVKAEGKKKQHFCFNLYVLGSMVFIWTTYVFLLRLTRMETPVESSYFASTAVLLSELIKLVISLLFIFKNNHFSVRSTGESIFVDYLQPKELLKGAVPSLCYAIQNNLDFLALSNLPAATYQVSCQLKVVTTAVFMVVLLGRRFSLTRWAGVVGLFAGVAIVQLDSLNADIATQVSKTNENYILGISAVLATCLLAGFAGCYFEMILKDGTCSLWVRNLQLYTSGLLINGCGVLVKDGSKILDKGFFHGYNFKVWIVIGLLSVGGVYVSLVVKFLDIFWKSIGSACCIITVALLSFVYLGATLGVYFLVGSTLVCVSIFLYNSVQK